MKISYRRQHNYLITHVTLFIQSLASVFKKATPFLAQENFCISVFATAVATSGKKQSRFYGDNGSAFSSHHLARICGKLGIQLSHSRAYRPAGRGKIERFFQFFDTSFKPEAYQQIEAGHIRTLAGHIRTLDELNRALASLAGRLLPPA